MIADPCKTCQGQGRQPKTQTLTLNIPAGVDTGTRLRVAGEGNVGPMGGPPGDLYVFLHVLPDPVFKREGYDLLVTVPVSYPQLALGGEVEIPTLEGPDTLKFPAATQSGTVFTLKHKGVPVLNSNGKFGNLHVQVVLEIPKKLSHEEKKLLEKLRDLEKEHKRKDTRDQSGSFVNQFKSILAGS
jgi:molecular chaperone DnaJ